MKKETEFLTYSSFFVLLFLMISGLLDGYLQTLVYILSFLVPPFLCLRLYFRGKKEEKMFSFDYIKIGKKEGVLTLGFVFPTVLIVFGISFLSVAFMLIFGKEQTNTVSETGIEALLIHAFLPAFLEEFAFRYVPLRIAGKRGGAGMIFLSASLFALVHHSFFSIPYAFAAGVLFMIADLVCDSVIPSFLTHFINNVCSLFVMGALGIAVELYTMFIILCVLSLFSLGVLFVYRKDLLSRLKGIFSEKESMSFTFEALFICVPSFLIAILELWG